MSININKTLSRPLVLDSHTWERFYSSWFDLLVGKLGGRYSQAVREDAVAWAFFKLMYKKPASAYGHLPESDDEWFCCLLWQAKAFLSHYHEHESTWQDHYENAFRDGYLTAAPNAVCTIDEAVSKDAAYATLASLCSDVGMKPENVLAYVRRYLDGEPSAKVAAEIGITCNNLHQIRRRVEDLLASRGPQRYREIRRRLFLEAA